MEGLVMKRILAIAAAAVMEAGLILAQTAGSAEVQLKAAEHKEQVEGDLKSAIEQYTKLAQSGNRAVAAKALVRMGQCYEKLGDTEARKAYERAIRDFGDQKEAAATARARLAAMELALGPTNHSVMVARRIWNGTDWGNLGPPSPDGRLFSCSDWETGGDLAICDLATGKKRRITNKPPDAPGAVTASMISPDGKQIAFNVNKGYASSELRVVGLDGSNSRVIYANNELRVIWPYAWSPDGKAILVLFNWKRDHSNQLVRVAVGDGSVRQVKTFGTKYPLMAAFSTDGRFIAYDFPQENDSQNRDIYVVSSNGGQETPVVQHPANEYLLGWTPDGNGVLFASDRTGSWDAWLVRVSEGRPQGAGQMVKKDIGKVWPLGFTRNGSFYYTLDANKTDLYLAAMDLATGKILTPPSPVSPRFVGSNVDAAWSPDGQSLAYFSFRGNADLGDATITLHIRSLQTGQERELSPKLHNLGGTRWSPDGRFIAVAGFDTDDRQGLYRIDAQTGDVSPIARCADGVSCEAGEFSPDGKTIFYVREEEASGTRTIRSRDLATGRETDLYRTSSAASVWNVTISPDGGQLAFTLIKTKAKESSLNIMPSTGGEPHELLTLKKPEAFSFQAAKWTRDGRELVYIKGRELANLAGWEGELWSIPAEGGEPRRLDLTGNGLRDVMFHPDGKRITYSSGTWSSEIWVMENFLPGLSAAK
jgi:Tol biopolymer transport system component